MVQLSSLRHSLTVPGCPGGLIMISRLPPALPHADTSMHWPGGIGADVAQSVAVIRDGFFAGILPAFAGKTAIGTPAGTTVLPRLQAGITTFSPAAQTIPRVKLTPGHCGSLPPAGQIWQSPATQRWSN